LQRAQREQVTPVPLYLDALLPDDHLARLIWAAVERLDLSAFAAEIKVVEGGPGRAAADPAVLVALWIYATSQGEHRAREVARLCTALCWPLRSSDPSTTVRPSPWDTINAASWAARPGLM